MRTKTNDCRTQTLAEEIREFAYNDEQEALCNEDVVLSLHSAMPAIQEFLQEMHELDSRRQS